MKIVKDKRKISKNKKVNKISFDDLETEIVTKGNFKINKLMLYSIASLMFIFTVVGVVSTFSYLIKLIF